ncbi:HTH-type transcriptional regulator TtgR [Peptococcaceae bacterium CEB3]|nr:HTH-type transcriptional regulator TtgR [Peptococcaceae bacterium CEB3]
MQENKKKILESSIGIFAKKGIHQATLADIAAAAGISKGTLFYYYKSKGELLYDILDISTAEITDLITGVIQASNGQVSEGCHPCPLCPPGSI